MYKQQTLFLLISLISIFILAWILQTNLLLSWDVSWLLHGTQRILTGGSYAKDFPDGDPPMILYLYAPTFLLMKMFSFQFFEAFRAYIFLLIFVSLSISYRLICEIFSRNSTTGMLFLITLAIVELIAPVFEFGQREHLIIILTMPYLLALSCRFEQSQILSYLAILIGILAGCGFAIKPHYCLIFALVEIYYIFYSRNLLAWLRIESLLIITILIAHFFVIVFFHRDYLTVVIPLLWRFYYVTIGTSWIKLIIQPSFIFCCFAVLLYLTQYQTNAYKTLSTIFCIALIGYIITYLVQRTSWYYHVLPMFSLAILLIFLVISALLIKNRNNSYDYLFFGLMLIFISIFPVFYIKDLYLFSIVYKDKTAKLREYLHNNALHQPVYFFSTIVTLEFPSVDYAGAIHVSRFGVLNWIPAMLKKTNNPLQQSKDEKYFIDTIANELNNFKPKWVFIDTLRYKEYLQGIDFNYLTYFSRNKQFQQAWKAYHYKTSIQQKPFYAVEVYQRDDQP